MSQKSDKVLSGYTELSETERAEVWDFMRAFDLAPTLQQKSLAESLEKVTNKTLGYKYGTNCPCCGKYS